jgi:hypothetical protein
MNSAASRPGTEQQQRKPQAAQQISSQPTESRQADRGGRGGGRGGRGGGRGGVGGDGGGRGGFSSTPGSRSTNSVVTLRSNHFRLNIGNEMIVYQYAMTVSPDEIVDASVIHEILGLKNRRLFKLLGAYVPSGQSIYVLAPIEEDVTIETSFQDRPCVINISKNTETTCVLNADFINRQNSVVQAIFNILFKQAFRQTHLKQIGRDPKFFDYERPI